MIRLRGSKMSKSKGNLIAPEEYYQTVGADGLRLFHLFAGPPGDDLDWTDQTDDVIEGCGRFLDRFYRLASSTTCTSTTTADERDLAVRQAAHRTIARVTRDFERWSYNTAVAAIMELFNTVSKGRAQRARASSARRSTRRSTRCRSCSRPWRPTSRPSSGSSATPSGRACTSSPGPSPIPRSSPRRRVTMVVQVNGKVRARLEVAPDISEEDARRAPRSPTRRSSRPFAARAPRASIARPPRLVNIVL